MRAFIALDFPPEINSYVKGVQEQLFGTSGLSIASSLHLTLKFLGEISEEKANEIKAALSNIALKRFSCIISSQGVFPGYNKPRVIWLGLKSDSLIELNRKIDDALIPLGFSRESFSPHVTLARVKFINDRDVLIARIRNLKVEEKSFQVSEFFLKKSVLSEKAPVYENLSRFSLQ
ncbi:MAG: RNA 2',3'-cyclic phosphodiesterase [Candidatus Woesearchaeota archaeon]|nr:RNA 2',3'-cyclic phosphodiesterase [Candidatus Woesearchaeota archaeon]